MLSLTCKDLAGIKTLLLMDTDQQRKLWLPKNVARINNHVYNIAFAPNARHNSIGMKLIT